MANTKISDLVAVAAAAGANELAVNEAGTTKKATITQITALLHADATFTGTTTFDDASNATVALVDNDGTGYGMSITQDGVLAAGKHALHVLNGTVASINAASAIVHFSNTIEGTTEPILELGQTHASSTADCFEIGQAGTMRSVFVHHTGVINGEAAVFIYSPTDQTDVDATLLGVVMGDSASLAECVSIENNGTGNTLLTNQVGDLATGKYALYIDNDGTPADGAGRALRFDGCDVASTKDPLTDAEAGWLGVNIGGTQYAIPYYALA